MTMMPIMVSFCCLALWGWYQVGGPGVSLQKEGQAARRGGSSFEPAEPGFVSVGGKGGGRV